MATTETIALEMPECEDIVFLSLTLQEVQRVEAYKYMSTCCSLFHSIIFDGNKGIETPKIFCGYLTLLGYSQNILNITKCCAESRDNSVGIKTRLLARQPRNRGLISSMGKRFSSSLHRRGQLCGSPNLLYSENRGMFLGVKLHGVEADDSPPSSA